MTIDFAEDVLRATSPKLWVVRHGDQPVGTIEQGRCYTALDTAGEVVARCSTLQAAWEALCADSAASAARARDGAGAARWIAEAGAVCAPLVALAELLVLVSRR